MFGVTVFDSAASLAQREGNMRPHEKNARRPIEPGAWNLSGHDVPDPITLGLGKALSHWGFLEQQLAALLSVTCGARGVGRAILQVVHSPGQRRELLQAIVSDGVSDELRAQLTPLIARYIALTKERNVYAHGLWGHHSGYPEEAILARDDVFADIAHLRELPFPEDIGPRIFNDVVLVSERDLTKFSAEISSLTGDMIGIIFQIQTDALRERLSNQLSSNNSEQTPPPDMG